MSGHCRSIWARVYDDSYDSRDTENSMRTECIKLERIRQEHVGSCDFVSADQEYKTEIPASF